MKEHRGINTDNAVQTKEENKVGEKNQTISQKNQHWNFKALPLLRMEGSNNGNHNVPISAFTDISSCGTEAS